MLYLLTKNMIWNSLITLFLYESVSKIKIKLKKLIKFFLNLKFIYGDEKIVRPRNTGLLSIFFYSYQI